MIFSHLYGAKKVQSPAKQFKELFSLVCYFFALNSPSSVMSHLKTAFILTNRNRVVFFMYLIKTHISQVFPKCTDILPN